VVDRLRRYRIVNYLASRVRSAFKMANGQSLLGLMTGLCEVSAKSARSRSQVLAGLVVILMQLRWSILVRSCN
jgi:hypothetical protein